MFALSYLCSSQACCLFLPRPLSLCHRHFPFLFRFCIASFITASLQNPLTTLYLGTQLPLLFRRNPPVPSTSSRMSRRLINRNSTLLSRESTASNNVYAYIDYSQPPWATLVFIRIFLHFLEMIFILWKYIFLERIVLLASRTLQTWRHMGISLGSLSNAWALQLSWERKRYQQEFEPKVIQRILDNRFCR